MSSEPRQSLAQGGAIGRVKPGEMYSRQGLTRRKFLIGLLPIAATTGGQLTRSADVDGFFHRIVESLRLLAADFEVQVSVLPAFVHIPDEVAMTFGDDAFLLADQVLRAGRITQHQYLRLKEIDDALTAMSGKEHAELWTLEALRSRPEWQRIRAMARGALSSLGMTVTRPKLDWVAYAPSRVAAEPLKGIQFDSEDH